jgi:hypothetical protein
MFPLSSALAKLSRVKEAGRPKGFPAANSSGVRTEVRINHTKGYTWMIRTIPSRILCTIRAVRRRLLLRWGGIAGSGARSGSGVDAAEAADEAVDAAVVLMVSHSPCETVRR